MSKLIDHLDEIILKAEEAGTSFDSDKVWDDAAHEVLASYDKLRAVVEAANRLRSTIHLNDEDGTWELFEAELLDECENYDKAFAVLEEGV